MSNPEETSRPRVAESLDPTSTGRWRIRAQGTTHVLDLDAGTYERRPRPTSRRFEHDDTVVTLTRVEVWPHVGGRMMVWFDDPCAPELLEHWRVCSRIQSITSDDSCRPAGHFSRGRRTLRPCPASSGRPPWDMRRKARAWALPVAGHGTAPHEPS